VKLTGRSHAFRALLKLEGRQKFEGAKAVKPYGAQAIDHNQLVSLQPEDFPKLMRLQEKPK
jgi:hypothetical protein